MAPRTSASASASESAGSPSGPAPRPSTGKSRVLDDTPSAITSPISSIVRATTQDGESLSKRDSPTLPNATSVNRVVAIAAVHLDGEVGQPGLTEDRITVEGGL